MPRAGGAPVGGHSSGGFPAAPPSGGSMADNKVVWIVLGVVALVAVVVLLIAATGGDGDESGAGGGGTETAGDGESGDGSEPEGYTEAVESAYLASCSPQGGEAACQCSWDAIVEQIPFEDFSAMEARVVEEPELAQDPERFAAEFPELQAIMEGCVGSS